VNKIKYTLDKDSPQPYEQFELLAAQQKSYEALAKSMGSTFLGWSEGIPIFRRGPDPVGDPVLFFAE